MRVMSVEGGPFKHEYTESIVCKWIIKRIVLILLRCVSQLENENIRKTIKYAFYELLTQVIRNAYNIPNYSDIDNKCILCQIFTQICNQIM